jgi:hypothetical protein
VTNSTKLHVNDRIAIKYAQAGSSTAFEMGHVKEIRRGIPRTVVIDLDGGITIYMLVEAPKKDAGHGSD